MSRTKHSNTKKLAKVREKRRATQGTVCPGVPQKGRKRKTNVSKQSPPAPSRTSRLEFQGTEREISPLAQAARAGLTDGYRRAMIEAAVPLRKHESSAALGSSASIR